MVDRTQFANWVSEEAKSLFDELLQQEAAPADIEGARNYYDAYNRCQLDKALQVYDVQYTEALLEDVVVHKVAPTGGAKIDGHLLCLHGGGFMWGSGAGALLEAVPVAATTGMAVTAINYRLAPEHLFPSAVDDVIAVYKTVLAAHAPDQIGIYGCSAGGILTAQVVARLIADSLPLPGAIAMFHGTGLDLVGDSAAMTSILSDVKTSPSMKDMPYFDSADLADPLVLPGNHPDILAHFPPSLLITGTRDFAASSVAVMHRRLLAAGASSEFVLFDGMWHAHHMSVDIPESLETFELVARFFRSHLGAR